MVTCARFLRKFSLVAAALAAALAFLAVPPAAAQAPQVHAVLFFSPTCPHCQYVIGEVLPPLMEAYGDQLQVLHIDITSVDGYALFNASLDVLDIPQDMRAVPFLIAGDQHMIGSFEVEQNFPPIIASSLAAGGLDWPGIPPLLDYIATLDLSQESAAPDTATWQAAFARDPLGNSLSIFVLVALLADGAWNLRRRERPGRDAKPWPEWVMPLLVLAGFFVAAYLTRIELTQQPAVCGPVGDCNAVQQSPYAMLFGVLPVGLLGLLGYLGFALLWFLDRRARHRSRLAINQVAWALALFGLLFSIYLTFLEPFVIGATCAWCLSSALIMGLIFWELTDQQLWLKASKPTRRTRSASQKRKGNTK